MILLKTKPTWDGKGTAVTCPCGTDAQVDSDGILGAHEPKQQWGYDGQRRSVIKDAYGIGFLCRYSGRTVTLAAALARDERLTEAEKRARDIAQKRAEAGVLYSPPAGYTLSKPLASLFMLADQCGWTTQQAWVPVRDSHTPGFNLSVRVSRAGISGPGWRYDLSYFVAPGIARRTRFGLCVTPDQRGVQDTPSVKAISAAIAANPVTSHVERTT